MKQLIVLFSLLRNRLITLIRKIQTAFCPLNDFVKKSTIPGGIKIYRNLTRLMIFIY